MMAVLLAINSSWIFAEHLSRLESLGLLIGQLALGACTYLLILLFFSKQSLIDLRQAAAHLVQRPTPTASANDA
jgi:hypothetical protein